MGNFISMVEGKMWLNGDFYEGRFSKEEQLYGKGKITRRSGEVLEGHFVRSVLHGKGKITQPDGSAEEGRFFEGRIYGKGKLTRPNGDVYECDFGIRYGYETQEIGNLLVVGRPNVVPKRSGVTRPEPVESIREFFGSTGVLDNEISAVLYEDFHYPMSEPSPTSRSPQIGYPI
jgi:hypothetical protein